MKRRLRNLFRATKLLLLVGVVLTIQKVNVINSNDKLSNESLNKTLDLTAMATKFDEIQYNDKYAPLDTFTGDLTGYSADCPLCSGRLGCTGQNVLDGTTTYTDGTYGTVRIVASSNNLACGSVIKWNSPRTGEVVAIVLDRGVLGNDIDLLVANASEATQKIGRSRITYDVLRNGWNR